MAPTPLHNVLLLETISDNAHEQLCKHAAVTLAPTPAGEVDSAVLEKV